MKSEADFQGKSDREYCMYSKWRQENQGNMERQKWSDHSVGFPLLPSPSAPRRLTFPPSLFLCGPELWVIPKQSALIQGKRPHSGPYWRTLFWTHCRHTDAPMYSCSLQSHTMVGCTAAFNAILLQQPQTRLFKCARFRLSLIMVVSFGLHVWYFRFT